MCISVDHLARYSLHTALSNTRCSVVIDGCMRACLHLCLQLVLWFRMPEQLFLVLAVRCTVRHFVHRIAFHTLDGCIRCGVVCGSHRQQQRLLVFPVEDVHSLFKNLFERVNDADAILHSIFNPFLRRRSTRNSSLQTRAFGRWSTYTHTRKHSTMK